MHKREEKQQIKKFNKSFTELLVNEKKLKAEIEWLLSYSLFKISPVFYILSNLKNKLKSIYEK